MKRIIIGALVGTLIYFGFQALMWMGGFHKDFYTYTPNQDTIMATLAANLSADGLYMMPMADANSPDFKSKQSELEKKMPGNPWVMIFYHPKMADFSLAVLFMGLLYAFIAALVTAFVLYFGKFPGFWWRFSVALCFALFTLAQGVMNEMNWWSYPWNFVKPQVMDLVIGWGLCSVWLAWFVKPKALAEKS
jgi:hypothetical protein